MTYQFRLRKEPFDFSYEFDDYENGLFESALELEPEFDDLEGEEEIRRRPRVVDPISRSRPPPHHRRPPRTIIRPWRVSAGVVYEPSICTCPEQTCPQHGSEYIRWVQSTLNGILGMRLPLNGVLTPATRSAIRSFQERENLPVTGIVGLDTERALIAARGGQSSGAGTTKQVEPGMIEPPEPAALPPEPGMTEPAEPAPTSPAAEFEFEWEVAPLGQRETQRLTAYSGQVVRFPSGEILRVVTGLPIGKHEDYWDPTGSGNPLLNTGPAHKDKKLSTSFTVRELTTSGGVSAHITRIDPKLVECLQRLRDHVGKGVKITSGFRSWKRNRDIYEKRGKTPTLSQHCAGRGADIHIAGMNGLEIGKAAIDACGPNIGVGLGNTFAHVDVRGFAAAWNYGGVKDSWVAEIKRYQKEKGSSSRKPSTPVRKEIDELEQPGGRKGSLPRLKPPMPGRWLTPFTSSSIPKYNDAAGKLQSTACSVYVSDAAWKEKTIDLLVFFHGDAGPCSDKFNPDTKNNSKKFGLDAQIHGSGRKVALAVPVVHWIAGKSANVLRKWTAANLNKFVEEVLVEIGKQSGVKPTLGRLIIAGHSHAYAILTPLACEFDQGAPATKVGALARLDEVWALDSTYASLHVHAFDVWARLLGSGRFIAVLYKKGTPLSHWKRYYNTQGYCSSGFKPPNLRMCIVDEGHCVIPTKYIGKLLSTTRSSQDWCKP